MIRTYTELISLPTFKERFEYLKLTGAIGVETFGFDRYLNQQFYRSREWKDLRDKIILRDNGCDLAMKDYDIYGRVIIHHMNPITYKDIVSMTEQVMDPEFLVCTTHTTHNAIHFGNSSAIQKSNIERTPNDTCPWRK